TPDLCCPLVFAFDPLYVVPQTKAKRLLSRFPRVLPRALEVLGNATRRFPGGNPSWFPLLAAGRWRRRPWQCWWLLLPCGRRHLPAIAFGSSLEPATRNRGTGA